jgi:membrane protease YdiL (CAAX protease family)
MSHAVVLAPDALLEAAIIGLFLGFVRWRTGSSIAAMITHCLSNVWADAGAMLVVGFGWP